MRLSPTSAPRRFLEESSLRGRSGINLGGSNTKEHTGDLWYVDERNTKPKQVDPRVTEPCQRRMQMKKTALQTAILVSFPKNVVIDAQTIRPATDPICINDRSPDR